MSLAFHSTGSARHKARREKLADRAALFSALERQLLAEAQVAMNAVAPITPSDECSATDVYLAEAHTLNHLVGRELALRAATYQDLLLSILTPSSYARLMAGFPGPNASDTDLREAAHGLSRRLHQRYVLVPAVEDIKGSISASMYLCMGVILLVTLAFLVISGLGPCRSVPVVYAISAAFGAIGATLSTHVRLHRINPRHEPLLTWLSLESGENSLIVSPIIGSIFAVVLTLLIHAGILESRLTPGISGIFNSVCQSDGVHVTTGHAALMLVAFAAGWAERAVPDVINRVTKRSASALVDHLDRRYSRTE